MKRAAPGFTLIETMIVVSIAAVLTVVALPNFTQFIRDQRIKSASFEVFSTLTLARSEAVLRNTSVTVTPTGGTTNWANGWEVTVGTEVLRKQDPFATITMTGPTSIVYTGSGRVSGAVATVEMSADGATSRCVSIDLSGRPVSKASAC
jgi:type IV fimbrial biogenesis protein FimT